MLPAVKGLREKREGLEGRVQLGALGEHNSKTLHDDVGGSATQSASMLRGARDARSELNPKLHGAAAMTHAAPARHAGVGSLKS